MDSSSKNNLVTVGNILGKHYEVEAILGQGGFGVVAKCRNTKNGRLSAIKINKSNPEALKQARSEIAILSRLRSLNADTCNIVRCHGYFYDNQCVCLDFELLDQNLYEYLGDRSFRGLPVSEVKPIIHQLATALSHLKSIGVIHADLKPENVMTIDRHQDPLKVKIIDFGLSCLVSAVKPGACVQTIWYRAPEVILHMQLNEALDIWSLGLTAVELATGRPLYPGDREYDVLKFIVDTQGQPPDYVLQRGSKTDEYFHCESRRQESWRFMDPAEFQSRTGFIHQDDRTIRLRCLDDLINHIKQQRGPQDDLNLFVDLIKGTLDLDVYQRLTPIGVLNHPFFGANSSQTPVPDPLNYPLKSSDRAQQVGSQPSCSQTSTQENIKHLNPTDERTVCGAITEDPQDSSQPTRSQTLQQESPQQTKQTEEK